MRSISSLVVHFNHAQPLKFFIGRWAKYNETKYNQTKYDETKYNGSKIEW
ncbi:MAG: hypothetical protein WCD53_13770 [Microcoleus sp.]